MKPKQLRDLLPNDEVEGAIAGVYLLHYEQRIHRDRPAQHYLGSAQDLVRRITEHTKSSSSAKLPAAFAQRGIAFKVARLWEGTWNKTHCPEEKILKRQKKITPYCPYCNPALAALQGKAEEVFLYLKESHHDNNCNARSERVRLQQAA